MNSNNPFGLHSAIKQDNLVYSLPNSAGNTPVKNRYSHVSYNDNNSAGNTPSKSRYAHVGFATAPNSNNLLTTSRNPLTNSSSSNPLTNSNSSGGGFSRSTSYSQELLKTLSSQGANAEINTRNSDSTSSNKSSTKSSSLTNVTSIRHFTDANSQHTVTSRSMNEQMHGITELPSPATLIKNNLMTRSNETVRRQLAEGNSTQYNGNRGFASVCCVTTDMNTNEQDDAAIGRNPASGASSPDTPVHHTGHNVFVDKSPVDFVNINNKKMQVPYPHPQQQTGSSQGSEDSNALHPDILKRIIEGRDESEIFDECLNGMDYDHKADMLANELTRFIRAGQGGIQLEQSESNRASLNQHVQKLETESASRNKETETEIRKAREELEDIKKQGNDSKDKLQEKLNKSKKEEERIKAKLNDAEEEITRLEENLQSTVDDLEKSNKKVKKLERENTDAKIRIKELEDEKSDDDQTKKLNKKVKDLERKNTDLKDQLNDVQTKFEKAKKDNKKGKTRGDEDELKVVDAGNVYASNGEDMEELQFKLLDRENAIEDLQTELEALNRQLDGRDGQQEMRKELKDRKDQCKELERDLELTKRQLAVREETAEMMNEDEANRLRDEHRDELQHLRDELEFEIQEREEQYEKEKKKMVKKYEKEIEEVRRSRGGGADEDDIEVAVRKERKRVENSHKEEKDEAEKIHQATIDQLEERVVNLEQELAQLGLSKVNAIADLEQKARIERLEWETQISNEKRDREKDRVNYDLKFHDMKNKHVDNVQELQTKYEDQLCIVRAELVDKTQHVAKQDERLMRNEALEDNMQQQQSQFSREVRAMRDAFQMERVELEEKANREKATLREQLALAHERDLQQQMKKMADLGNDYQMYKEEWEKSFVKEKQALLESFQREKSESERTWHQEKRILEEKFGISKERLLKEFKEDRAEAAEKENRRRVDTEKQWRREVETMKAQWEQDFKMRMQRESELLESTVEHLEKELSCLKSQKKELEAKMQVLELKEITQKQEAIELEAIQRDKRETQSKMEHLQESLEKRNGEIVKLRNEIDLLRSDATSKEREKATILDNSVREITDQQETITKLTCQKDSLSEKVENYLDMEVELERVRKNNGKLQEEKIKLQRALTALEQVKKENLEMHESVKVFQRRQRDLEAALQEKLVQNSRLKDELQHQKLKLDNEGQISRKELDAQKERLQLTTTASETEKSRYQREITDLRDQLYRISQDQDRDVELKDKIFNDAKGEVFSLNKKLEEKGKIIRQQDQTLKELDQKLKQALDNRDDLEAQIMDLREQLEEKIGDWNDTKLNLSNKSMQRDSLVSELYIENADLVKQLQKVEGNQLQSDKSIRQLTEQKRALQRVISKLCTASGITTT